VTGSITRQHVNIRAVLTGARFPLADSGSGKRTLEEHEMSYRQKTETTDVIVSHCRCNAFVDKILGGYTTLQ